MYFAQYIVLAAPVLDPRIRRAIQQFPQLVMAGACLPDLALISRRFKTTHHWQQAQKLLTEANTEEELAIAVGYTSHLFVDIVAHNHFVPALEAKWLNATLLTHISAEWAMDAYLQPLLTQRPYHLLKQHWDIITPFIAQRFGSGELLTKRAVRRLAWADKLLRCSRLSYLCLKVIKRRDDEFLLKLDYYLAQTELALHHFEPVLKGQTPAMFAELTHMSATEMVVWREKCLIDARLRLTTAIQVYQDYAQQFTAPRA